MLSTIILWIFVAIFFAVNTLFLLNRWDLILFIALPVFIIFIVVISSCIIIIPPTEQPSKWATNPPYSTYGYSTTTIYPPGYEGFKSPFEHIDIIRNNYHNIKIMVPTQTSDGMRVYFLFAFLHVKWQPQAFASQFNHDEDIFKQYIIGKIKPTVDRIMQTKSEANVELNGGATVDEIYKAVMPLIHPHTYLTHEDNLAVEHQAYFQHIDNPQFNYACNGIGGGYCSYGDSLGLPQSPNRYQGQPIPYKDRSVTIVPTPEPTTEYTYMDDSHSPASQAELDAIIEEVLAMPEFQ